MSGRDANQLAADVPDEVLERIQRPHNFVPYSLYDEVTKLAENALGDILRERRELVGLVGTLKQERDKSEADYFRAADRADNAEAALATTRQALTEIAQNDYWRDGDALRSVARRALADIGGDTNLAQPHLSLETKFIPNAGDVT